MAEKFYYANEDGTEYRRPRWWLGYLAGSILVMLGIVIPCGGFMAVGLSIQAPVGSTFKPPGKATVQIAETGEQVIWVDEPDNSSLYASPPVIPDDITFVVTSPNGADVPARRPVEELTCTTMHSTRNGAATFAADFKGAYTVEVKGTFGTSQIIAITPDQSHREAALGLGAIVLILVAILLVGAGITVLVITGVRHVRAGKSPV
jgi:hypothetical protein